MSSAPRCALLIANAYATTGAVLLYWRPAFLLPAMEGRFAAQAAFFVACVAGLVTGVALLFYYAALVLRSDRSTAVRVTWLAALFFAAPVSTIAAWFVFVRGDHVRPPPSGGQSLGGRREPPIGVVALAVAILLVVVATRSFRRGEATRDADAVPQQKLAWLSAEAASLAHPPDAVPVSSSGGASRLKKGGGAARLETAYRTPSTPDQVRSFYDSELEPRGWRIVAERPLLDHGVPAGTLTTYCRDGYAVVLQYSPSDDWTYSLSFSWRLFPECE